MSDRTPDFWTEDGWEWYLQSDGTLTDHPDPSKSDLGFDSIDQAKEFTDGEFFEHTDEMAQKRINKQRLGLMEGMEEFRAEKGSPDVKYEKALKEQKSKADAIRKMGLKVVKKGGPKLAALMGGPIGWGIAGASLLGDAQDAYSMVEGAVNPKDEREREVQRMLAESMRNTEYDR